MAIDKLVKTFGIGLVAGFVGTAAITASQMVEMRMRGRKPSKSPAKAAEKVLHLSPEDEKAEEQLSTAVHWAYGTGWGLFRPVASALGLTGWPATAAHAVAIQGTAMVMLPGMKVAPPVKEWGAEEIAVEMMHHAVYAVAAGLTYDALCRRFLAESLPEQAVAAVKQTRLPIGAVSAALAALAVRARQLTRATQEAVEQMGPAKPGPVKVPTFRVSWWERVPDTVRDRINDWERKLEGV